MRFRTPPSPGHLFLLTGASLALTFGPTGPASAAIVEPELEIIDGLNNHFRVGEFGYDIFGPEVHYLVDVLSPTASIHAMAFSFLSTDPAGDDAGANNSLPNWDGILVDADAWDTHSFLIGGGSAITGASIGVFDDLFGTTDDIVALYWDQSGTTPINEANDIEEPAWDPFVDTHFDRFGGLIFSEAIALDASGGLIDASLPSALAAAPEASELAIFTLGGLGLLAHRRRRAKTS